jgi:hypothetical protein
MPGATATLDLNVGSEPATRVADRAGPDFLLPQVSAPGISADNEPLYKKLVSNFTIVPELKS